MTLQRVLIDGEWRAADAGSTFQAENPAQQEAKLTSQSQGKQASK